MSAGTLIRSLTALVPIAVVGGCVFGGDDDETSESVGSSTGRMTTTSTAPDTEGDVDHRSEEATGAAMVLIMDASGSMNELDQDGQPLIEGAKGALHGVVEALPDGTQVGLRVYGHRFPNTDRANGCQDTELIHPVEPLDRDAMLTAIDSYQAVGFTPIGLSLQQALADLPAEGPRTIVLVSDGEDTCAPPDPCEIAATVRADGVDLVIHTVGFALPDEASRNQLECIAQAGGGQFHDTQNAADLADTLEDVSEREARRHRPSGAELVGSPIPRDAATGKIATLYTDTVLGDEVNFYRFEIEPGSEITVEVVFVGDPANDAMVCSPNVFLTDRGDQSYSHGPFPGGAASETFIKITDPAVIEDDEVWVKLDLGRCVGAPTNRESVFVAEFQVLAEKP